MKLNENRLVGENAFENTVLRNLVADKLIEFGDVDAFEEAGVTEPGETGVMSVKVKWYEGSLDFEVWLEAESHCEDPHCWDPECSAFVLWFKWRTSEQEGFWNELEDIFEWDETAPSAATSGGLKLITE
jgi:hypothetical protein